MGDYDGDGDSEYGGDDGDGFDSDMTGSDGNPIVYVNGEALTEMDSPQGRILVDGDRNVVATKEPDGDIRFEDGHTLTEVDDGSGYREYSSTEGGVVTMRDGTTGLTDYQTDGSGDTGVDSGISDINGSAYDGPGAIESDATGDSSGADGGFAASGSDNVPVRKRGDSRTSRYGERQNSFRRSEPITLGSILFAVLAVTLFFGIPALFASMMVATVLSSQIGSVGALVTNALVTIFLGAIVLGVWIGKKMWKSWTGTLACLSLMMGYFSGLILFIIFLATQ